MSLTQAQTDALPDWVREVLRESEGYPCAWTKEEIQRVCVALADARIGQKAAEAEVERLRGCLKQVVERLPQIARSTNALAEEEGLINWLKLNAADKADEPNLEQEKP